MQAVLFDMDGVLVNSEDYWTDFQRDQLLPAAVPDNDVDVAEVTGMNYRETYDYLEETYGTAIGRDDFENRFETAAQTMYRDHVDLLDGLPGLLDRLDERGLETAVVSSSPQEWIGWVLERFDLEDAFDEVISAEDIDADGKPAPDVFEYAASEVGAVPESCVVIEDSEHGVEAGTRAGAFVIAYRIDAHDGLDLSTADDVVESPAELRKTVLEASGH
ncbi:HAD family phosphatase [Natronolimnobius sp. AArcel1]|uniref:HAD family hydrolase n=1 Tax=Natronolimnobius sp. AArcel1 TaxID=1679093 RepID=UPI0013EDD1FE|nr:HAD family phosphatase [Natronolimnobius sp. AArcel1]NGM68943.1 HAD family phosphatase [Natronolimnobius sp. AArcel1]